ncbi:MAG: hypothetical protein ACK46Q_01005 [Hyphomonas sp.]
MDIPSIQPTDIAIFLVSFAACAYCIVLSRRLKALQNTKDGLGATITAMSNSVAAMSTATHDTRTRVESMATRLTFLIAEGEKMCDRLETTIMQMETSQTKAADQVHAAQSELNTMMRDVLDQSRDRITEMSAMMRQMRYLTDTPPGPARLGEPPSPLTRSRTA